MGGWFCTGLPCCVGAAVELLSGGIMSLLLKDSGLVCQDQVRAFIMLLVEDQRLPHSPPRKIISFNAQ